MLLSDQNKTKQKQKQDERPKISGIHVQKPLSTLYVIILSGSHDCLPNFSIVKETHLKAPVCFRFNHYFDIELLKNGYIYM